MDGERSTGLGGVGEDGERMISSRSSAMTLVSSGREEEVEGSGGSRSWMGLEPNKGAVSILIARAARLNIYQVWRSAPHFILFACVMGCRRITYN
jgi:hypothetical protein